MLREQGLEIGERLVPREIIDFMLEPYFENCRYLREANMTFPSEGRPVMNARLSIPHCCYGHGPGHFNATEFILGFNQMAYVYLANAIEEDINLGLGMRTKEEFKEKQMDGSYIVRLNEIRFRKPIHPQDFTGNLRVDRLRVQGPNTFYTMNIGFEDRNEGEARGSILISVANNNK